MPLRGGPTPLWKKIARSGTWDLQRNDNALAASAYLTKQNHWDSCVDRLILSDEFLPT